MRNVYAYIAYKKKINKIEFLQKKKVIKIVLFLFFTGKCCVRFLDFKNRTMKKYKKQKIP